MGVWVNAWQNKDPNFRSSSGDVKKIINRFNQQKVDAVVDGAVAKVESDHDAGIKGGEIETADGFEISTLVGV